MSESSTVASRAERAWGMAIAGSTLFHLGVLAALAGVVAVLVAGKGGSETALDTRWSGGDDDLPDIAAAHRSPVESIAARTTVPFALFAAAVVDPRPPEIVEPARELLARDAFGEPAGAELLVAVGEAGTVGAGVSDGTAGAGPGRFFGIKAEGKRFVYVVDCSGSMNAPYPGRGKTRFGRLKLELLDSIGGLAEGSEFFIIFFDQNPHPMPADSMQPAIPQVQEAYLRWMADVRANGETDPRAALALAFALRPDVIYLLTDGNFHSDVRRDLVKLKQNQIAIHTFAFGERKGETVLKTIAANNAGGFTFVP